MAVHHGGRDGSAAKTLAKKDSSKKSSTIFCSQFLTMAGTKGSEAMIILCLIRLWIE